MATHRPTAHSPKDRLAAAFFYSGLADLLHRLSKPALLVVCYHRIRPEDAPTRTAFDDQVFGPTPSQLRAQIAWLQKNTTILSEEELVTLIRSGRPFPPATSYITFDDGYRDNYDLALPILEETSAPATFFIPTMLINERQLGWWDILAYLLKNSRKHSIRFLGRDLSLRPVEGAIQTLQEMLRKTTAGPSEVLLAQIADACEVDFPERGTQDAELMTWDQIRDASKRGVSIGSHTHRHHRLSALDSAGVEEELRLSRSILRRNIDQEICSLAYPYGGKVHYNETCQHLARRCGYELAFSLNTGRNPRRIENPFDIGRVSSGILVERLAAIAAAPSLFSWPTDN